MRRRSTPSTSTLTRVLSATAMLVAGSLITFAGASYFELFAPKQISAAPSRDGMVKVPRSLRGLTALKKVTREDIHDLARGDESYFWMEKARVEAHPEWITNPTDIIGRVMSRNKEANLVFTAKDFLPEGSRTGLSGGVPEGKQGFFVDSTKIPGLALLRMGDKFDLLAGLPEETQEEQEAEYGLLAGGVKVRGGKPIPISGVRFLVQGAQMVAVTRGREMTTQGEMQLPELDARARSKSATTQITIAIDPEEVVPLTQALAADRVIHCVARSGQAASDDAVSIREQLAQMRPFPATSRPLKAYSRISAEDLADVDTGELRTYYFPEEAVQEGWITSVDSLIGRVVSHDVSAGFVFSESDLLPPDAPAGVAGGTPAGLMAISVDTETVRGIDRLQRGDRFDLLASEPAGTNDFAALGADVKVSSGVVAAGLQDRARNIVLAHGALIVDIGEGTATIAVRPEEVPSITKAITLETSIYALARSGRSATESTSAAPLLQSDPSPVGRVTLIEEIVGGERTVRVFARPRRRTEE